MFFHFLFMSLISFLTCQIVFKALKKFQIFDIPNSRSSHDKPTIRGGGVSIIICTIIIFALSDTTITTAQKTSVLFGIFLLAFISFYDDMKSIKSSIRFCAHIGLSFFLLKLLGLIESDSGEIIFGQFSLNIIFSTIIYLIWVVGYTNAFNFMDGINGIATLQCIITASGSVLLAHALGVGLFHWASYLTAITGAVCIGFLPFNFPIAKMFMGDVGSASLGMILAITSIALVQATDWVLFLPLVLLHANFIMDTLITLLNRMFKGEKWYSAHRSHFYQKLQRSGKTHFYVTCLITVLQILILNLVLLTVKYDILPQIVLLTIVVFIWAIFFAYCQIKFDKNCKTKEQH